MSKSVLITGASSGIGAATARLLAKNGFNVMLTARRVDKLEALKNEIGDKAAVIACDVNDSEAVKRAVQATVDQFGSLDVLINNAGLGHLGPMSETPLEEWHHMMNVNVNGLLSCIHYATPHLLEAKGNIINIASVAGHDVFPNAVVYCATKHAVRAISKGLRLEYRGRIKTTDISPGAVGTEFLDHTNHEATSTAYKEGAFKGVILQSEDIATAILDVLTKPDYVVISEVIIRPNQ
ncbi:MAG: SDR family oxidoreductase [Bacteroidota bacterium]